MKYIFLSVVYFLVSFGTITIETISGQTLSMSQFHGKKVLIVNVATRSPYKQQLTELEQLRTKHGDSLVIIVCPTNDFDSEPKDSSELRHYFKDSIQVGYIIMKPSSVIGQNKSLLFEWLADKDSNGMGKAIPTRNFQKFLINEKGQLSAVFASKTAPLSPEVEQAIAIHY